MATFTLFPRLAPELRDMILDVVSVSISDDITPEDVQEFASRHDENQWEITPIDDSIKQKYWDTVKASEYYYDTMRMLDSPWTILEERMDSCVVYLTRDAKNKFLGSHPLETTVLRHNLTLEVPESARSRMRNIVCAGHRVPPPDPNSMGMWRLRSRLGLWLWKTHVFAQLNNPTSGRFLALSNPMPLNMCDEGDGLEILDTAAQEGAQGGVQSLTLTEWRREDDISDSWGWSLTGPFEV
ncbi:hypothetical protein PG995_005874 [Apiospora arundinis]